MAQNSISFLAVLAALTFVALAVAGCASPAQVSEASEVVQTAVLDDPASVPEFHGARIGGDALRSRLPTE
jgi:hypothetical protein